MIDRFTCWPEAIPLQDYTTNTVAKMFFTHWVARFEALRLITTDQGSQFEAQLFDTLTKLIGSKRCRTTAYHPESNGIIERWHRSLKTALMCHGESQWTENLSQRRSRRFGSGISVRQGIRWIFLLWRNAERPTNFRRRFPRNYAKVAA